MFLTHRCLGLAIFFILSIQLGAASSIHMESGQTLSISNSQSIEGELENYSSFRASSEDTHESESNTHSDSHSHCHSCLNCFMAILGNDENLEYQAVNGPNNATYSSYPISSHILNMYRPPKIS